MPEVNNMIDPNDVSMETIEKLFYQQIRKLSKATALNSFDYQFSDRYQGFAI